MNSFLPFFLVAMGGALGALVRYSVALAVPPLTENRFPAATLLVNVAGCFLLGVVGTWLLQERANAELWRHAVAVGFLGSLTTYSTFAFEKHLYVEGGSWWMACVYAAATLGLGLAAVRSGAFVSRLMLP